MVCEWGLATRNTVITYFTAALEDMVDAFGSVIGVCDWNGPFSDVDLGNVSIIRMFDPTCVSSTMPGTIVKFAIVVRAPVPNTGGEFVAFAMWCGVTTVLIGVTYMVGWGRSGICSWRLRWC